MKCAVLRDREPARDRRGDHSTEALGRRQVGLAGSHDRVEVAERTAQPVGRRRTEVLDAERGQQPGQRPMTSSPGSRLTRRSALIVAKPSSASSCVDA